MKRHLLLALVPLALGMQPSLAADVLAGGRLRTSATIEELLSCIDQQVALSRLRNAAEQDALDPLGQIVEREANQPFSPSLRAALARIVDISTQRAKAERVRGGHPIDNLVIAAMAAKALEDVDAAGASAAVVIASVAAHKTDGGLAAAAASRQTAEFFAARGDEMLAQNNLSAARKFYAFAVQGGSSRAAYALARSYEPSANGQTSGADVASDITMARSWYAKAVELGSEKAKVRLQALSQDAAK